MQAVIVVFVVLPLALGAFVLFSRRSLPSSVSFDQLSREDQVSAMENRRGGAARQGGLQAKGDLNGFRHNGGGSLGP